MATTLTILEDLASLVRSIGRLFYDEKHIVILEFLLSVRMISDEELAERMQALSRDVNRVAAKLREDGLLRTETRAEMRASDQRTFSKTYYYIDYRHLVNTVKYKIFKMRARIDENLNNADSKSYRCPQCERTFSALEMQSLINPRTYVFECDTCGAELREDEKAVEPSSMTPQLSSFNDQTLPVVRLLKKIEIGLIPPFSPADWFKEKAQKDAIQRVLDASLPESARFGEYSQVRELTGAGDVSIPISVEFQDEKALNQRPLSNDMPVWHTQSTVLTEMAEDSAQDGTPEPTEPQEEECNMDDYYSQLTSKSTGQLFGEPSAEERGHERKRAHVDEAAEESDDVFILVGGKKMSIYDVAEEDKSKMTAEEYTAYYKAYAGL